MGWEGGAEKVDILLIYCIRLQIKTCMYVCMWIILWRGYSMEELGRSVLLSLQTLILVKTIIIHFATCLTTRDLIV